MRTITRYIVSSFFVTFLASLLVLTFVLSIGAVFRVTDLIARGVPWWPIFRIFLCAMPDALSIAIPIAVLASSLLVFSRLSADSEITAMKACGISMWSIVSRPAALSLALVAICLQNNNYLAPETHFIRRASAAQLGMQSPMELLDEGRFIEDFAGLTIYVGKRQHGLLHDIRIIDSREAGVRREIKASQGTVSVAENGKDMLLNLSTVRIDPARIENGRPVPGFVGSYTVRIENALSVHSYRKRDADMNTDELWDGITDTARFYPDAKGEELARQRSVLVFQLNERIVLAVSCFTFVLLGAMLGIRSQRRESSIGIALSLLVMFCFFLFIILAESQSKRPEMHPELIIWLPVAISFGLALHLLRRLN